MNSKFLTSISCVFPCIFVHFCFFLLTRANFQRRKGIASPVVFLNQYKLRIALQACFLCISVFSKARANFQRGKGIASPVAIL